MKKEKNFVKKLLAGFCAASLLFGALSCSSGSDDDDEPVDVNTDPGKNDTEIDYSIPDADEELPDSSLIPASATVTVTAPSAAGTVTLVADTAPATSLYTGNSVQGALEYLMTNSCTDAYTINVASGTYEEMLFYTGSASITIVGGGSADYGADVLIKYSNSGNSNAMDNLAKSHSVTSGYTRGATRFDGTCNLVLKNLTIQNTYSRSANDGSSTQAEALVFSSTGNLVAYNCSFLGHQDTLYLGQKGGRMWFYKDYIRGDVDFIWGYADVALFEECVLNVTNDDGASNAYIFASRTVEENNVNKGFVLMNSYVVVDDNIKTYYGRNSGSDTTAAVINNVFSQAVQPALWGSAASIVKDAAGDAASAYKDRNNAVGSTLISDGSRLANTFKMTDRVLKREYNGRYAILNRGFDTTEKTYHAAATEWDISAYETEFNATADTSKANVYVEPVYSHNVIGGETVQLSGDCATSGVSYTFASSDESLATVDSNGLVTTKADVAGLVKITMTGFNGNTDVSYVKVIKAEIPATSLSVSLASSSVAKYGVTTATVTFEPADTSDQTFTLTSSSSNVLFFDESSQKLASSTTVEASDGSATVSVWVAGEAKLTATSDAYSSATAGTATVSVTEGAVTWGDSCAWRVATDIQSGKYGIYDGLVIDSESDDNDLISTDGKMSLKTNSKMQTKNVTLYIPVEGASTVTINMASAFASTTDAYFSVGSESSSSFTANDDNTVYTYTYDGSATGIVLGSAISPTGNLQKQAGEGISANGKYLKVNAVGKTDRYPSSITVQKTGDFTATWDDSTTTQTGASGTYSLISALSEGDSAVSGESSDGFVSWTNLTYHNSTYCSTSNSTTVSIQVSGASIITLSGCYSGTNGKTLTVKDSSDNTIVSGVYTSSDQTLSFLYTGEATTLTITWSGFAYITAVKVSDGTGATESVSAVSVSGASEIAVGATANFTATVSAAYITTDTSVTWSSSNTNVATVDSNGVVTAVSAGNATITATSVFDSTKSGSASVQVSASVSDTFEETTTISFGSSGNYTSLTKLDISNATIRDNGGNNSQISAGSISFKVKSGAVISVSSYSGYTSYTLSDGTTTSDTQTGTSYEYTATSDCTITLTTVNSNNYLYSITITYTE